MKRRRRYHIVILREDGKQYHNSILSWFQVRKHVTLFSGIVGGLLLGTAGFFVMVSWHGNLVASNLNLLRRENQLRQTVTKLAERLDQTRTQISESERELARIAALARQQNLKVPQSVAGTGGAARDTNPLPSIRVSSKDPKIVEVAQAIQDLSGESAMVRNHTRGLSMVLLPHLEGMARTPSVFPAKGFITSGFGSRQDPIDGMPAYHEGVDISATHGSPVVAPAEGIVVFTGWRTGLGNTVEISHGRGLTTRFGHLATISVRTGQTVKRWQKIAAVGSTGRSTGSHLHYEIRLGDKPVNPMKFLAVGY
jgi:murein DD-endopeptidase MepM/ murein hydrolase activator NlpD